MIDQLKFGDPDSNNNFDRINYGDYFMKGARQINGVSRENMSMLQNLAKHSLSKDSISAQSLAELKGNVGLHKPSSIERFRVIL